ncbi:hypothetical protein CONCODRAFT_42091 [Conidiobolus coronatus NRRL 28638]|uniref:Lytic polysaccharide monooxygenase n=1 Tax=Conidiobolus coronatus (strain ATCC 28846 / CBS 209.66 / NRRL 28638) TaxID=796925 RepID=A0A137NZ34_CONC2|nr:hypothetical protein CONCODRAFT_42091 [Conidiobolus coronatus NRRL 28638]|eukprot:KXN68100.1 hypothetical protein CONCODRAFT_42091 [Conidiobolus coronatus NRRL 28638]
MRIISYLVSFATLVSFGSAHMEIQNPPPRKSQYSKYYQQTNNVDWDLNSPLGNVNGLSYPYPCRGAPQGPPQANYTAGSTIDVKFLKVAASNLHNGGHCQFGISYDNGKTVAVLSTVLTRCFLDGLTFPVTIPATAAPSDKAVLVWAWINAIGNREYYSNCVDIRITGGSPSGSITGPQLLIGNLPGYVTFPEFYQGDKKELFAQRPTITIKP